MVKPLHRKVIFRNMKKIILKRNTIDVINMIKLLHIAVIFKIRKEYILEKNPMNLIKAVDFCTPSQIFHFGIASTMGCPSRPSAVVRWNQSEPRREVLYTAEGITREVTQALWRSPKDCECIPVFVC